MRTKSVLFVLLLAFVGIDIQAQIVTSKSMSITKHKKPPFEKTLYLAAGGALNTMANSHYAIKTGYEAVLGYQQNFKRDRAFGSQWGIEAGVTTHGQKLDQTFYSFDDAPLCLMVSPFTYSYRFGSKSFWVEPHIGAEVNIRLDDDGDSEERYAYSDSKEPYWHSDVDGDGFDVGIRLGLRMWIARRISLDVAGRIGVLEREHKLWFRTYTYDEVAKSWNAHETEPDLDSRNVSLIVRVGVKLNK